MRDRSLTLALVKPDAFEQRCVGAVLGALEEAGFHVVAADLASLSEAEAEAFYAEHRGQPFYERLVRFMTSGPSLALALEREHAIGTLRTVIGATVPAEADPDTIRGRWGGELPRNVIHASDSGPSAERELSFFFARRTLVRGRAEGDDG